MIEAKDLLQYKIIIVNFNPTIGTEIQKTRPCLIISPNEMNHDNIIIAPMTSKYKDYPTRLKLSNDSYVALDQVRTISIKRVVKITPTKINNKQISNIKNILKVMLID